MLSKIELRELILREIRQTQRLMTEIEAEASCVFSPLRASQRFQQCGCFDGDWSKLDDGDWFTDEPEQRRVH